MSDQKTIAKAEKLWKKASQCLEKGDPKKAYPLLWQMNQLVPENPDVISNLANCAFQTERFGIAIENFEKYISMVSPAPIDTVCSLALAYQSVDRHSDAETLLKKLCGATPDPQPHLMLARMYLNLGRTTDAIPVLLRCVQYEPDNPRTLSNLADAYYSNQDYTSAIEYYQRSLQLDPGQSIVYRVLGSSLIQTGEVDKGVAAYKSALKLNPDDTITRHQLNAVSGKTTKAPPLQYISSLFDQYAESFEKILVADLNYVVPQLLRQEVDKIIASLETDMFEAALDLGGGTGLVAKEFRDIVKVIHNVDISEEMIKVSRQFNVYDDLFVDDIISFLDNEKSGLPFYDLALAGDTCIYLGDLAPIYLGVYKRLTPGGWFIFNVERVDEGDFKIQSNGRYSHSEEYLKKIATEFGFTDYRVVEIVARQENNNNLDGYICCLQKPMR